MEEEEENCCCRDEGENEGRKEYSGKRVCFGEMTAGLIDPSSNVTHSKSVILKVVYLPDPSF